MSTDLLRDLTRAKAMFQLRAIEAIIQASASAMSASGQDAEERLEAKPASAAPKEDAR